MPPEPPPVVGGGGGGGVTVVVGVDCVVGWVVVSCVVVL
jgi:hypothetical protein